MSTDLAVHMQTRPAITHWNADYRRLVMNTIMRPKDRDATGAELALFAEQCVRTGLNPFLKQIYAIYRYDKRAGGEVMSIQTGIDGFRLLASRNPRYNGQTPVEWCGADGAWTDVWLAKGNPAAARVGVFLSGAPQAVYAVALWSEYKQNSPMWSSMPANQLAKCCEALALRKACPAELSGLTTMDERAAVERIDPVGSPEYVAATSGVDIPVIEGVPADEADDQDREGQITATEDLGEQIGVERMLLLLSAGGAQSTETVRAAVLSMPRPAVHGVLEQAEAELGAPS